MTWLIVTAVAWGVLAFGAVYPWAYWPLMAAAVAGSEPDWARHPLSLYPDSTIRSLAFLVAFSLLLAGLTKSLHAGGLRRLTERLAVLAVVVALIGIIQAATVTTGNVYGLWAPLPGFGDPGRSSKSEVWTPEQGGQPFGPFVNKNHFAGWMVMALALAIGLCCGRIARGMRGVKPGWRARILWFSSPDANRLILTAFAAVVMGLALVLSLSRSGITCFAVAIVISAWFMARRQTTASKRAVAGA